jgi:hypothetical protein
MPRITSTNIVYEVASCPLIPDNVANSYVWFQLMYISLANTTIAQINNKDRRRKAPIHALFIMNHFSHPSAERKIRYQFVDGISQVVR